MVNLSSNNSNNVRISAGGQRNINVNSPTDNNINANNNGNSQRARSWAIGEGLIDGEDYSAKYWAEQAKISEEIARESIDAENNAQIWAEGTDEEVEAIGGTHSSKGWVDYVIENAPTASVEETEQGAVLTVTDINGTTTATIYNGADGQNGQDGAPGQDGRDGTDGVNGQDGQDGFSPIATVTQTSSGATISITDKNGTTTANIANGINGTNGRDGTNGTDGDDGFSPTATVTKSGSVATITITDKNGTTTANVYDGTGGGGSVTEVFVATYGTTTLAEIETAVNANKVVICYYNDYVYVLNTITKDGNNDVIGFDFLNVNYAQTNNIQWVNVDDSNVWDNGSNTHLTPNTTTTIWGTFTFQGEKKIKFKQSTLNDKIGFTLYNTSSTELGALEYRPNTISGSALLNINCPYSADYVGFRYWGTAVNIIAPKVATAGDYYIPVNITDGNTTVTANASGTVDISSLLPNVSGYLENTATGSNSLSIFGSDATYNDAINIGYNSNAIGSHSVTIGCESYDAYYPEAGNFSVAIGNGAIAETNSVAIGYEAHCYYNTNNSIAIGNQASVHKSGNNTTTYAIQLGEGSNTTSNTMQVWNYPLLDKTTGLIPDARLSSNIARTSQIPTVPTNVSAFTNDSGYITSSALSGYATETWVGQQGFITSASLPTMTYTSATETLTFG